jgi:putative membrane protein
MIGIFLTWVAKTLSFLIILELPLGLEIDGFNKATAIALVFGGFNATLHPIFISLSFPITFFTFGFFVFFSIQFSLF